VHLLLPRDVKCLRSCPNRVFAFAARGDVPLGPLRGMRACKHPGCQVGCLHGHLHSKALCCGYPRVGKAFRTPFPLFRRLVRHPETFPSRRKSIAGSFSQGRGLPVLWKSISFTFVNIFIDDFFGNKSCPGEVRLIIRPPLPP
jgi:hypothetical protein